MKKIMFNDKYRLTQAVLEGSKTQTRRILLPHTVRELENGNDYQGVIRLYSKYKVGEVVAVAQRYKDIALDVPVETCCGVDKTTRVDEQNVYQSRYSDPPYTHNENSN